MAKIKVRKGESLEQALRRFNKETLNIVREVRERERYQKPSELRRIKRKELARKIYIEKKYNRK